MSKSISKKDVLIIFLLTQSVLLLHFYWDFITGSKQFFIRDLANFFEPLCRFISVSVSKGQFPLWNPYAYCGMPETAISSPSLLYPPSLLFCLLPFGTALALFLILSQLICALGAILLVQSLGWGTLAAILFASALSLCGYMFSLSGNYTMVATASWFPLLIWAIRHTRDSGNSFLKTSFVSLSLFMMLTAGRPEIWLPAIIVASFFALYISYFESNLEHRGKRLFFLIRAFLIGVLLSLPAILPALEWTPLSRRAGGLASSEILMFSASWYDFFCMFASLPLGDLQLRMANFQPLVDAHTLGRFLGSSFLSAPVFALAFLGIEPGPSKKYSPAMMCTIIITLIFAALSAAGNFPASDQLITLIPGASLLRFPSKLLFFFASGVAILAARGLRNYLGGVVHLRWHVVIWSSITIAFASLLPQSVVLLPFTAAAQNHQLALEAQKIIALHGLAWSAAALSLILIFWLLQKLNSKHIAASIACVASIGALYSSAYIHYRNGAQPDYFEQSSTLANQLRAFNNNEKKFLRYAPVYVQGFTIPPDYKDTEQVSATVKAGQYSRQMLNGFSNIDFGIPSAYGFEGAMKGDYFFFYMSAYGKSSQYLASPADPQSKPTDIPLARLLQLIASPYVITQCYREGAIASSAGQPVIGRAAVPFLDKELFTLKFQDDKLNARLYELNADAPHAYLSYNWKAKTDNEEICTEILNSEKTEFDPAQYSLIEADSDDPAVQTQMHESSKSGLSEGSKQIEITDDGQIELEAKKPCLLVLADQFYPGWKAWVDDEESKIYRCNGFVRAVLLAPGKHHVRFAYAPPSFYYGCILALVALVWMAYLLAADLIANRRA